MADFNDINTRKNIPDTEVQQFRDRVIMDPDLNDGSVQPRQIGDTIPQETVAPKLNNPDVQTTVTQATTNVPTQQTVVVPKEDPSVSPAGSNTISGMRMLSPEEAAQLENVDMVKVDGGDNGAVIHDNAEEIKEIRSKPTSDLASMMENALATEKRNADEFEAMMSDPEKRKQVFKDMDDPVSGPNDRVEYSRRLGQTQYENTDFDPSTLVPGYDDDDIDLEAEETPAEATDEDQDKAEAPEFENEEDYAEYVKKLEIVKPTNESIVSTVKDRVTAIPSNRMQSKTVDDSAFMSAINKFKKDNFRTVSVPLLNSGFCVDMVGTGAVDLNLLYSNTNDTTTRAEYEVERMKITMRNVVGTSPKISKNDLRNMIHFADYSMMAYGHITATLKTIEMVQTCVNCGQDFRIVCNSSDMIINLNEIKDRANAIKAATSANENSLMLKDQEFTADNGFDIILGHPSYAEYIQYSDEVRNMVDGFNSFEQAQFSRVATILPFIRSIVMPNGIRTNTIRQKFLALGMLSDDDLTELMSTVNKLSNEIITPRFGIKSVKCPHCGKVHNDITYDDLEQMLFFHFTITRLTSSIEE